MTDNEIIKVLNNELKCVKRQFGGMCDNKRDCGRCDLALSDNVVISAYENALDLINRQRAENENLKVDLAKCSIRLDNLYKTADEIKSEAIKEFAQRLEKRLLDLDFHPKTAKKTVPTDELKTSCNWILHEVMPQETDNLVKEMTEVE